MALTLDTHSWVRWHTGDDPQAARRQRRGGGALSNAVRSCYYGQVMEHFGAYPRRFGVVMGLGTDCSSRAHNLVEEMRKAPRCWPAPPRATSTPSMSPDFLHAATAGGAAALLRDDIGRPGRYAQKGRSGAGRVDLACPQMQPARDPLRGFVYHAADRAVRDVFGRRRAGGSPASKVLTPRPGGRRRAPRRGPENWLMEAAAPQRDYLRRKAEAISRWQTGLLLAD